MTAARLRASRCNEELNIPGWCPLPELPELIRRWETVNGKVSGAVGWERSLMDWEMEDAGMEVEA
jgi:hypothetical protein